VGRGCFWLVHVDADVTVAGAEGALHGDWMREEAGIVQSRDRAFSCGCGRLRDLHGRFPQ
jgi:hypothetical protein